MNPSERNREGARPLGLVELRVRYGETDRMGIAYYGVYLDWFTEGRTELMRQVGFPYRELEEEGIFLPVVEARCRYFHSVTYDDSIRIQTWVSRLGRVRIDFQYRITQRVEPSGEEILVAEGETRHAFVDADTKPLDIRKRTPEGWENLQRLVLADGSQGGEPWHDEREQSREQA